jgi:molybdopterin adenylyltransferase
MSIRTAIITISNSKSRGEGEDTGGAALAAWAEGIGVELVGRDLIPDDRDQIEARLCHWADVEHCELVLTTGGTGFTASDVTPEATKAVIERDVPGIGEAMRAAAREYTKHWMLSRALAGIRGTTLIINFPGNPKSIAESGAAIADALPHGLALIAGRHSAH